MVVISPHRSNISWIISSEMSKAQMKHYLIRWWPRKDTTHSDTRTGKSFTRSRDTPHHDWETTKHTTVGMKPGEKRNSIKNSHQTNTQEHKDQSYTTGWTVWTSNITAHETPQKNNYQTNTHEDTDQSYITTDSTGRTVWTSKITAHEIPQKIAIRPTHRKIQTKAI
jgi:hypothetical protein